MLAKNDTPGMWRHKDPRESRRKREAAKAAGEIIYYTGHPCKFGHNDGRYVANGLCVVCSYGKAKIKGVIPNRPADSRCQCCREVRPLVRDHDHETGLFRGWLCQSCNRGIGQLRDDPKIIRCAFRYLNKSKKELSC